MHHFTNHTRERRNPIIIITRNASIPNIKANPSLRRSQIPVIKVLEVPKVVSSIF